LLIINVKTKLFYRAYIIIAQLGGVVVTLCTVFCTFWLQK